MPEPVGGAAPPATSMWGDKQRTRSADAMVAGVAARQEAEGEGREAAERREAAEGADSKRHAIAALPAGGKLEPQSVRRAVPWASAWLGSTSTNEGGREASWYVKARPDEDSSSPSSVRRSRVVCGTAAGALGLG